MTDLSPAAQAVLNTVLNEAEPRSAQLQAIADAAAVIRALVEACAYTVRYHPTNSELNEMAIDEADAIAIAAELDGTTTPTES